MVPAWLKRKSSARRGTLDGGKGCSNSRLTAPIVPACARSHGWHSGPLECLRKKVPAGSPGTLFHLLRCEFAMEVPVLQHAQSYEHPKYADLDIGLWVLALSLLAGLVVILGLSIGGTL